MNTPIPTLLDRELFFGDIPISGSQISPTGTYISFLRPYNGICNLWLKEATLPFDTAKPVSAECHRPIAAYFWSRDGRYLIYVQDRAGDENFNIYIIDASAAFHHSDGAPAACNVTRSEGVQARLYFLPKTDPDLLYVGLNDRDKAWHDLYALRLSTGELVQMYQNTDRITSWCFDNNGDLRLALRTALNGDMEILRVSGDGLSLIYSCDVFDNCGFIRFDNSNELAYMFSNKDTEFIGLHTINPADGQVTLIEQDPLQRGDLYNALFSDIDNRLMATMYNDARNRLYWKDAAFAADYEWLQKKLPDHELVLGSHTDDEESWLIYVHSDIEPGDTYLFKRATKELQFQYRLRVALPRTSLSRQKSIRYKSSDGMVISAYLTLPRGVQPKGLPLIVFPHGGPWARDQWGYDSFVQFLANRGYAVLQPNYRGSTGFGKKYLNAGNGEWGRKMQDDLSWGAKYVVKKGIADPKRIGIVGRSYGGYATLAGLAFTPDLYAVGVSIVGPSNLITLLSSIPPYWEAYRKMMYLRLGDPGTILGKEMLEAASPLNKADQIKRPLMVVQGANDARVNKRESDCIVAAVRDHGLPVRYLVVPDEGHVFICPINNLAIVAAMEHFLAQHLRGRFQDSVSMEISTRLDEITLLQ